MKITYQATIRYKIRKNHPDYNCVMLWKNKWVKPRANRICEFQDVYYFDLDYFGVDYDREKFQHYMKSDLLKCAGCGLVDSIETISFDIKQI